MNEIDSRNDAESGGRRDDRDRARGRVERDDVTEAHREERRACEVHRREQIVGRRSDLRVHPEEDEAQDRHDDDEDLVQRDGVERSLDRSAHARGCDCGHRRYPAAQIALISAVPRRRARAEEQSRRTGVPFP